MKSFPPFRLDEANQCLWRSDTRVSLMPKPFAVLRYLIEHADRLVTQDELLSAIWPDTYVQPEVLRRYILEIRRVLEDKAESPRFVQTFPKRGYQFIATVTEDTATAAPRGPIGATTSLVGRQKAFSDLDGYLRKALNRQRQVVFVGGEAGIGKTSLVDAFQNSAEGIFGVRVARGQSVEGFVGKEPYYPIFEALSQPAKGSDATRLVETLGAHAPTWLIQFPSLVKAEQRAALEREIAGATRERMVRELCEALEGLTATTGLVIILEDLHWADYSTLDLISAIARRREPAKLLLLGTFRPADLIVSESPLKTLKQDLLLHRLSYELSLERLAESEVAEYLQGKCADGEINVGLARLIHRHSDGNPLFMTAMLDHLCQQGVFARVGGRYKMTVPLEQIDPGVPETLRHMLELQLQHLTEEQQELLKCASVAGERFTAWSIATMMGSALAEIEHQCAAVAELEHFLRAGGTHELSNEVLSSEYEFTHSLYREVLYRQLNPEQRVKFHRLLANGLEALRSPAQPEAAAEIALHFEEGREYERAIQYLIIAAENSTRRYAHRESITTLEHARELLTRIKNERQAEFDIQILEKIGDAYYALGELERSAATYHTLAVRAADAGLLATEANALMRLAHSAEAIPFFLKAIELDPSFASGYVSLSRIYSNLGEADRAREYAKLAYEHKDDVSVRECLSIIYQYEFEVTGNQLSASQALEVWKYAFPEEFQPANSLAYIYNVLGDFVRAVEEAREAVRRNPSHGFPYSNLAHAYRGLGKFDEARKTAEEAVRRNIETLPTRRLLYQLAILKGDQEAARLNLEWGRDRPREFEFLAARAQVAAGAGKLGEARQLYDEVAVMADARNLAEVGSGNLAAASWMELAFGNDSRACDLARRVLARKPGYDPSLRAALTLALSGFAEETDSIVNELTVADPEHTIINSVLAPIVRAGIALGRNQPAQAIEELRLVAPYDLGFCAALAPLHLRAHSYLLQGLGLEAAREFERILDHQGSEPFSPFHTVAPLGLARAQAMAGNVVASLQAYEVFLNGWIDADSDIPVLIDARQEYRLLKADARTSGVNANTKSGAGSRN
jgi:DNA-binding winged helix-turn-helix (wHTH) protein/tetratricopeptide (TPR) repeat protein